MQTYNHLKAVLRYEIEWNQHHGDMDWTAVIDHDATLRDVWRWLGRQGDLGKIRALESDWRRSEYLHAAMLDYLSMNEPKTKARTNENAI